MSVEELQGVVGAIGGVKQAQVDQTGTRDPVVKVWLDGSREPTAVARDVDAALRAAGFSTQASSATDLAPATGSSKPVSGRPNGTSGRRGLGRGLDALIQPIEGGTVPEFSRGIASVALVQSTATCVVRVTDRAGRSADAQVDPGLDEFMGATVVAVAGLLRVEPAPTLTASDERLLGGARVVSVVLDLGEENGLVAGSAVVRSGELLAYSQAIWAALRPVS